MNLEERICANPDCDNRFEPLVHNAIYCGEDCRKVITNQRVLDKYYEKKEQKALNRSTKRICGREGCSTILSIYNDEKICEAHKTERLKDRLESWGWDRTELDEDWSY